MIVEPVGESTHADPDAFEHAVASELVHDERGLHPAGLLVRVGHDAPDEVKMLMLIMMMMMMMMMTMMMMMHDAPDEVRLCRVQRVHQGGELHQVDRGHRLPSAALLLLSLCLLFLK